MTRIVALEAENERLRKMGLALLEEWRDAASWHIDGLYGDGPAAMKEYREKEAEYLRRKAEWKKQA